MKKNWYLRSEKFFAKLKKPIFQYKYGKRIRFGHCRKSNRVMKKRSWSLQVDPNINLLSKKIDTFAPRHFSQKWKNRFFRINLIWEKGQIRPFSKKRVMEKRSWGLQVDLHINLLSKKIDTFARRDVSQNWKNRFFNV